MALCYKEAAPWHLGLYAWSLELFDYDYLAHPQFYDFCRGVMASPHSGHLGRDRELMEEFPPRLLPGLAARCWWCPEMIDRSR